MHPAIRKIIIFPAIVFSTAYSQQFMLENIGWSKGLNSASIYSIIQDKQGYIWMSGSDGLYKYDGSTIMLCNSTNNWPVNDDAVYDLFLDDNNLLWVGSSDTCLFATKNFHGKKQFTFFPEIRRCKKILTYKDKLWCIAGTNLFEISDLKIQHTYPLPHPVEYNKDIAASICKDRLYIGTRMNGLITFDLEKKEVIENPDSFDRGQFPIFTVNTVNDQVYLGYSSAIRKLGDYELIKTKNVGVVLDIFEDPSGLMWVTGYEGICLLKGVQTQNFISAHNNYFSTVGFFSHLVDAEQNIWLGSNGSGIYLIGNKNIIRYSNRNYPVDPVYGMVQDKHDKYWFNYFGDYYTTLTIPESDIPNPDTIATPTLGGLATYDPINDEVWFLGIWGVLHVGKQKTTFYDQSKGIDLNMLSNIGFSMNDTAIYTCGEFGLNKIKNGIVTQIYPADTTLKLITFKMAFAKDRTYLATDAGLMKLENSKIVRPVFREQSDYLKDESKVICSDMFGSFFVGLKNNKILHLFQNKQGEEAYNIYDLYEMAQFEGPYNICIRDNYFAIRNLSQVLIVDLKSMYAGKPIVIRKYDQTDGLKPETAYLSEMYFDNQFNLWVNGTYGALKFSFLQDKTNLVEPKINLSSILINGSITDLASYSKGMDSVSLLPIKLKLPYNKNEISFEFQSLTFKNRNKIYFKTRLIGLSDNWSNPFKEDHITYNNLSPGKYTFQVQGCNEDGIWTKEPFSFTFHIKPPWYQQTWFRLLAAVGLAGLIYLLFMIRIYRLKQAKNRQEKFTQAILESQEEERKRISRDLHDGLGQELSMLKIGAEKENNSGMLARINKIIDDVRFLSRNIHPHYFEKLGLSKALEHLVDENKELGRIYWVHEIENTDARFNPQQQLVIFRIVQECINNITKHSQAKNAKLTVTHTNGKTVISLMDNGIGFNVDQKKISSLGLSTIVERVKQLNGTVSIKSKPGSGTRTEITIPDSRG